MQYRTSLGALEERYEALGTEIERVERQLGALGGAQLEMRQERARIAEEIDRQKPPSPLLAQLRVASPCSASWEKMTGDEKVRFCGECKKHVYNVTEMTRREAEALLEQKKSEELCVRFYERADGTILTQDCPVGVAKKQRRKMALAVIGGTAMWGAGIAAAASFVSSIARSETGDAQIGALELAPRAAQGFLRVNGEDGARVTIDGEIAATLPSAMFALQPGTHHVRLERADRSGSEERSIVITSGAVAELTQTPRAAPVAVPPGRWLAGGRMPIPSPVVGVPPAVRRF